ncbi:MAG: hypothetical protein MJ066_03700, partial [Clostridia bacterium]|nr:hypothetical protein [Clostridia bacterium]
MIKIIDIDELFDKYISDYVYKNIGKIKPEEIENEMPKMYEKFGDEKLKELDNKTPNTFYRQYSMAQLLECLKEHLEDKVSVSDFLCEAIVDKKSEAKEIINELNKDYGEEYIAYLMNFISEVGEEIPYKRYLEFAIYDYPETISELAVEFLSKDCERVKEDVLLNYNEVSEEKKERLLEILSNKKNDDRVFNLLIEEFVKHQNKIPFYASLIVKYGDDRALPFLMQAIKDSKIGYADFEELRFSIEALGGEYNEKRDFSQDKAYKKIKGERIDT